MQRDRRRAIQQLAQLDPGLSSTTRRSIARSNFLHLGETIVTGCSLSSRSGGSPIFDDQLNGIQIEGLEEFRQKIAAYCREGGVIGVSGHLGAWEMAAAVTGEMGYSVLAKRYSDTALQKIVEGIRLRLGIRLIYQDQSLIRVLRLLRDNQLVTMLVDLDIRMMEGLHVPFLGKTAHTTAAPARLALKTGSILLPYYLVKTADHYRFEMDEPIRVTELDPQDDPEDQVLELTLRMNQSIERAIRRHPEQWVWMHPRWKSTPEVIRARKARVTG